jgi:murein endopeptidase
MKGRLSITRTSLKTPQGSSATVLSVLLATAVSATLAMLPPAPPPPANGPVDPVPQEVREAGPASRAVGKPFAGRLVNGVPFPPVGASYFTYDPILKRSPNRVWRRYATVRTVARVLSVLDAFHKANPEAPRIPVGDLSRPSGGEFGARYGGLGHNSHQNGLDVDIYYPRLDGLETAPINPRDVDQRLSQDLVDRFVAAGAEYVFTGPRLRLRGPRGVVQKLAHHDDHLHVRFRP